MRNTWKNHKAWAIQVKHNKFNFDCKYWCFLNELKSYTILGKPWYLTQNTTKICNKQSNEKWFYTNLLSSFFLSPHELWQLFGQLFQLQVFSGPEHLFSSPNSVERKRNKVSYLLPYDQKLTNNYFADFTVYTSLLTSAMKASKGSMSSSWGWRE